MSAASHGPLRAGSVGPKSATIGSADGGREVQRPGVARHHQPRAARQRQQIGDAGRRSRASRRRCDAATTAGRERLLARPPQHDRQQTVPPASSAATSPKLAGGQRLFGHAAPGLISA